MHETFEHKADVGVRGTGKSLEEAFAECAKAMFSVMADLEKVKAGKAVKVEAEAESRENLLVEFLNQMLYLRDVRQMLFNSFDLYIIEGGKIWKLKGKAFGEKINKETQGIKSDVKAASYHQLKVEESKGKFIAQCVVDV